MAAPESDAYHMYHDWGEDDLCTSIGVGLLKATDPEVGDLGTPLYDVIDLDALETLLKPRDGDRGTVEQVQFTIEGHTVTISSHEEIAHIIVHSAEPIPSEPPVS